MKPNFVDLDILETGYLLLVDRPKTFGIGEEIKP
jgi:hypothetical protein